LIDSELENCEGCDVRMDHSRNNQKSYIKVHVGGVYVKGGSDLGSKPNDLNSNMEVLCWWCASVM
jgi:hypothetical protein